MNKRGFALLLMLLLVLVALPAAAEGTLVHLQFPVTYEYEMARDVLPYVNRFRTGEVDVESDPDTLWQWNAANTEQVAVAPMGTLRYDYGLEKVAMQRAAETAVYWDHLRPDQTACTTIFPDGMMPRGENIAAGASSAEQVYLGWRETDMNYAGQGHRRNMLNAEYDCIGIGCVKYNGIYYWAQSLAKGSDTGVEAVQEATVATVVTVETSLSLLAENGLGKLTPTETSVVLAVGESIALPTVNETHNNTFVSVSMLVLDPLWQSEDSTKAKVENGQLVGVAPGHTRLSWTAGGSTASIEVAVGDHDWGEGEVITEPTCTEPGLRRYTCLCGETNDAVLPAIGHDWKTQFRWEDDCSACTEVWVCQHDSSHTEDQETVIPSKETLVEGSCTQMGQIRYTARFSSGWSTSRTTYSYVHQETIDSEAVAATCTTDGLTEGRRCALCGVMLELPQTVPALGHEWGEATYEWAADNSTVTASHTCQREGCGQTETETVNPALSGTPPTCEHAGEAQYTAAFTKAGFATQTTTVSGTALGHDWGEATYEWAADNSTVTASRVCRREGCGQADAETVNAVPNVITPAACESAGETRYTAGFTKAYFAAQEKTVSIAALGHNWSTPTYQWAADNSLVTASHFCMREGCDAEATETKPTHHELCLAPTETTEGAVGYRTEAFDDPAFAVQEKPTEPIPALQDMRTLYLPASLRLIGAEGFAGAERVQAVIIPSSCTEIRAGAFQGCAELIYARVPAGCAVAEDAFDSGVIIDQAAE